MAKKKEEPKARGRKKRFTKADIPDLAEKFEAWGREGLIDSEIAKRLGISLSSLYNYKNEFPELAEALHKAKAEADYLVKESLFKKANGFYYYEEEEIFDDMGALIRTKRMKKFIAPDTKAMQIWLQNREPEEWREKKELQVEQDLVIDVNLIGLDDEDE